MKIALILGTNSGQADIIRFLNKQGWETHVCGFKEEGPGCKLAHHFHLVNTLDIEALKMLAVKIKADIVYSVSSDSAITSATIVSESLGLPHLLNESYLNLFNNKNEFRQFLNENGIGVTKFEVVNQQNINNVKWNDFPCVVKPTDAQGQRGVQLISSKQELNAALVLAIDTSKNKEAIIEEYLDGKEFSTNVVVQNGKILLNEFSNRLVFGTEYFGLPKGHSLPITYIDEKQLEIAKSYVFKIVEKLEITDAVLYIQMKLKGIEPRVIEIAPRLDGCHIWRLIKHYRGVDLREFAIKCLLREEINIDGYIVNPLKKGSVLEFYHLPTFEVFSKAKLAIKEECSFSEFRYEEGEKVNPINGKLEVVGYSIYDKE